MFGGPFNRLSFNRTATSIEKLFSVTFESLTEADARLNLEMSIAVTYDSATELDALITREIHFAADIETATEVLTQLIRELFLASTIESKTDFVAAVTYSHVDELTFNGGFKPGDRLVIDTKRKTVTLNGQNALHLIDGNFFELISGVNKITYTDNAAARNILTRITHRDKYLY
ncbi:phage tail family protein [Paenibacillus sp. VCA1]|uniref:phage distal tail protein n=1 Tax=Paenibacillus sp. VCA1 TaxID=3039148 RepID=UPI0028711653|nr:phage tail domain-containing protein [Paenibacillus sp. VCA1]MDR9852885.1 phage tail family protein [Paenibacillus sp. VCA1]